MRCQRLALLLKVNTIFAKTVCKALFISVYSPTNLLEIIPEVLLSGAGISLLIMKKKLVCLLYRLVVSFSYFSVKKKIAKPYRRSHVKQQGGAFLLIPL
jgi:hypothetical protein